MYKMIPCVNAGDMPDVVRHWCEDYEYSTHYHNSVAIIEDDGNPFAEWLKEMGVPKEKQEEHHYTDDKGIKHSYMSPCYAWMVAIIAT